MPNPDDFGPMSPEDWSDLQDCADRFEKAWKANPDTVKIDDYLPAFNSSFRRTVLYELVKLDLEFRWDSDKAFPLDWYLEHYPELGTRETVSAELVFEELRNKHKHGMPVKLESYQKNYPLQFPKLKQLIDSGLVGGTSGLPGATLGRTSGGRSGNAVIPEPGVLAREYQLIKKIGEGSFAEVWMAKHTDSGKEVAVKYLHRPMSADESQRELESLELMKRLEHPHLLEFHSYWIEHNRLWVVMGLATHGHMKTRLRECKRQGLVAIPVDELTGYMAQIADAIDYLHDEGIQHRDIKPENILLFGRRYAKLADFGLAKQMAPDKDRTRTIGGTPLYQAPEMFDGDVVNRMSDQYCFAFTYTELRLGESPFHGRPLHKLPAAHKTETPDLSALPPLEQQVLLRALAKDPNARYPSCKDFVNELIEAIAESRKLGLIPAVAKTPSGLEQRPVTGTKKTDPTPVGQQSGEPKPSPSTHDRDLAAPGKRSTFDIAPVGPGQTPTKSPVAPAAQTPSQPEAQTPSSTSVEPKTDPAAGTIRFGKPGSRRPPTQEFVMPPLTDVPGSPPPPPVKPVTPQKPAPLSVKTFEVEDYVVYEVIGKGEYGEVRKARHKVTGREVALKRLYRSVNDDTTRREMEHLRSFKELKHESLVQFLDCIVDPTDQAWIVMELADGGSLKDRLHACRKGIPIDELLPYIKGIASGLDYLNSRGIVHRDVKPANILLSGGVAKLTDFGLARLAAHDVTKTLGGTPLYQAPEMFEGKVVKGASDQYCLAMSYAELRRGEHPFAEFLDGAGKMRGLQHAHRMEAPNLSGLTAAEQKVLQTALAKQYQDRFVTCTEFVEALEEAIAEEARASARPAKSPPRSKPEPKSGHRYKDESGSSYEDESGGTGFGWLAAAVVLLAVIGGSIWYFTRIDPIAVADAINKSIAQFVLADPLELDKAWSKVEEGAKLGPPWKEQVAGHFDECAQKRIEEFENAGDLKKACEVAKFVVERRPDNKALVGPKQKWLDKVDGQIAAGDVQALDEILAFKKTLQEETLTDPHRAVWQSAIAFAAAKNEKGNAAVLATLTALPDKAAALRKPLYEKLFNQCLKANQYRFVFDAVKNHGPHLPDEGKPYRSRAYQELTARLSTAIYEDIADWTVSDIFQRYLFNDEKPKVREQVQAAYVKRMETWLSTVKDAYDKEPKAGHAMIDKIDNLPGEFRKAYDADLKSGLDEQRKYWKCLYDLDMCLAKKAPDLQPKDVFKRYLDLVNSKGVLPPLDLDRHTNRVVDLAKEHPGVVDMDSMKKVAAKSEEIGLKPPTQKRVAMYLAAAPLPAAVANMQKLLALWEKSSLASDNIPGLIDAWKLLSDGDKKEIGDSFAAVANKYLMHHFLDADKEWRQRLDLCEATPEKTVVVLACALECRSELKEKFDAPATWQSLKDQLEKLPSPVDERAKRAYTGYLKALAFAADKEKVAKALFEVNEDDLRQLPTDYRRQRVVNMLVDASPTAKRHGSLQKQFEPRNDADTAYECLSRADGLHPKGEFALPKENLIDLVLAAANLTNPKAIDDKTREKVTRFAATLIADDDLSKNGKLSQALYPVTMAYAQLSKSPATVVGAYAQMLDRLKGDDRKEIDNFEFSREVLRHGIELGRENIAQLRDQDKAKLARLMGEQATLILADKEDAEKLARWTKEFDGEALAEAKALFAEASKLDGKNAAYRAGSQWLTAISKLQTARTEQDELKKWNAFAGAITAYEQAVQSATEMQASQWLFLSKLYLDLHQAELEFGNFYWNLDNWLPKGYGANFEARKNTKAHLDKALTYALEAKKALDAAGDTSLDLEIRVQEALGNAYQDLAFRAKVNEQQNYSTAEKELTKAIKELGSKRPASWTGRGRVRYYWAEFEKVDPKKAKALLKQAEADFLEARRLAGDGWQAIEPKHFLATVYWKLNKIDRPDIHKEVMDLYGNLPAKPSESSFAQNNARGYVKEAILALSRQPGPDLESYAGLMHGIDPSLAAELFLRYASTQAAGKEVITELDQIAGANPGALKSAVVVMLGKMLVKKHQDEKTEIPEEKRAKLLEQLQKNCNDAPDNYLKLWSRYILATVLYFSAREQDAKEAVANYREAKKLADELLRKHGNMQQIKDTIEQIKEYRLYTGSTRTGWKNLDGDEWDRLYSLYEDGAKFLRILAGQNSGKKRDEYLNEALSFVNMAVSLAPRGLKERFETLKRGIEDDMRMK